MRLTPYERETSILMNDEDEFAIVTTYQRSMLAKLRKNPSATLIEEWTFQGTAGGQYKIPKNLVSVRAPRTKRQLSDKQREDLTERGRKLGQSRRGGYASGDCPASELASPPASVTRRRPT